MFFFGGSPKRLFGPPYDENLGSMIRELVKVRGKKAMNLGELALCVGEKTRRPKPEDQSWFSELLHGTYRARGNIRDVIHAIVDCSDPDDAVVWERMLYMADLLDVAFRRYSTAYFKGEPWGGES